MTMNWKKFFAVTLITIAVAGWAGCGGQDSNSGPGSDGMVDIGSRIVITSFSVDDGFGASFAVDVVQDICASGNAEKFFDAGMTATVDVMAPADGKVPQSGAYIQAYRVEFSSAEPGAVPIATNNFVTTAYIPPGSSMTLPRLPILTTSQKDRWTIDGGDPTLSVTYDVKITLFGVNEFGYAFSTVAHFEIVVSDYDHC
jgi:hypothetical protein